MFFRIYGQELTFQASIKQPVNFLWRFYSLRLFPNLIVLSVLDLWWNKLTPLNEPLSSLSQFFIDGSIHLSHTKWLVSPSQLTILPKIYLAITSNIFGKFTWGRKKILHQLLFYGSFPAFLKLRKFPSTSLNLTFSCCNVI